MQTRATILLAAITGATIGLAGCGEEDGPTLVTAKGTVTLDGKPLADADITLVPTGETGGLGGEGRSNANGEFTIASKRGGELISPGEYRAVVSKRLMPDGSPVPADDDTPPIESPARESLPARFSSEEASKLTANVAADQPIKLELKSK